MDQEKFKKLVTAMLLIIMTGNIDTRVQYLGVLCDHLQYWIVKEKYTKDRATILNVRQHLIDAFGFIVTSNIEKYEIDREKYRKIQEQFKKYCIVLDASWNTPQADFMAQTFKELEGLASAKQYYFLAVENFSSYLTGSAEGLSNATIQTENAMRIIMEICYDNDLCDISEGEFRKAMVPHPVPSQPEPIRNSR